MPQLPLLISPRTSAKFANFLALHNSDVAAHLKALLKTREPFTYLWGGRGTGKSHLLFALCDSAARNNLQSAYLSLNSCNEFQSTDLVALEHVEVVCLDDIQHIAGNQELELALFSLINSLRENGKIAVIAGDLPLNALNLLVADLRSRLAGGLTYQIHDEADSTKIRILAAEAERRGIRLQSDVSNYLMQNYRRDLTSLMKLLADIDAASLVAQKRVTIPFIKKWLASHSDLLS